MVTNGDKGGRGGSKIGIFTVTYFLNGPLALSQSEYVELDLRETSYSTISKVTSEFSYQQWQKAWERATAGCKTRDIIPSVRTKVRWSKLRD